MATNGDQLVVPVFKTVAIENKAKTRKEGRPIFEDQEVVEVRFAGNRQTVSVFPAHAFSHWETDIEGNQVQKTYAERWSDQYRRFKEKSQQVKEGTPLAELPFLTEAKRSELRALNIHTAESLAGVDGQELKNLGQGGRDLKNQAQAYIDNASGSADVTRLAAENEELKRRLADQDGKGGAKKKAQATPDEDDDDGEVDDTGKAIESCTDAELKAYIKRETGEAVRGNPSRETLISRANEIAKANERVED